MTGVTGPDRQEDQPVGTVWIGVASGEAPVSAHRVDIDGDPDCVRHRAVDYAVSIAANHLS